VWVKDILNLCFWFILSCVVPCSFILACCFVEIMRTNGTKNVLKIGKEYIVFHENMEDFYLVLSCLDFLI
jgi:NADH:ubiquinone oxidoreductase subunit B-like Fe-S oxidoreductase